MKPSLPGRIWWLAAGLMEPWVRLYLWRRVARGKEIASRLQERRGHATLLRPAGRLLWLHAASVGETVSVIALLEALCAADPKLHVLMTTGSLTSQDLLARRLRASGLETRVLQQFVPLDVPRWVARFLDHWQPQAAGLVESELWPNLIASFGDMPAALVNARMSARSMRNWRRMRRLSAAMLQSFHWINARSAEDAERLLALGARHVDCPGDIKAAAPALAADEAELHRLQGCLAGRPVLLAASTHDGEEAEIARAHTRLRTALPGLLTIIVPRHPERGVEIAAQLGGAPRRSLGQDPEAAHGFWISDTLGEMGLLYRLSPVVFLGNSLDAARSGGGGHNPFEPARLGCAIAIGPLTANFNDAIRTLQDAGAITVTPDAKALAAWAGRLLADPDALAAARRASLAVATEAADLIPALAQRLLSLMPESGN